MTAPADTLIKSYVCDGETDTFPITFDYEDSAEIVCFLKDTSDDSYEQMVAGTDFTVVDDNVVTSGYYPSGYDIYITRDLTLSQESAYSEGDPMPAQRVEDDFDTGVKLAQQNDALLKRAMLYSVVTGVLGPVEVDEPQEEHFLLYRGGQYVHVQHFGGGGMDILTFMETILESSDLDTMLVNMGADAAWHEVGGSGEPTFENSWGNVGGAYENCAFRIDVSGFVHLKGRITGGPGDTVVFTLPATRRPENTQLFNVATEAAGDIEINSVGEVKVLT